MYSGALPVLLLLLISPALGQTPEQKPAAEEPSMLGSFLDAGMPDEVLFAVRKPSIDGHWYANIAYYSTDQCRTTFPHEFRRKAVHLQRQNQGSSHDLRRPRGQYPRPADSLRRPETHLRVPAQRKTALQSVRNQHRRHRPETTDRSGRGRFARHGRLPRPIPRPDGTISSPRTCPTARSSSAPRGPIDTFNAG